MNTLDLRAAVDAALAGRRLLSHPFYRRWEAGELGRGELAAYAAQYRHFETALPSLLRGILAQLDAESPAAAPVRENLADEESNPMAHADLFERFAAAVAAPAAAPTAATRQLLETYRRVVSDGPAAGVAGLTAYEVQAPEIAATKARGLRTHYGLDAWGTQFWDVHAAMDLDHAEWAVDALAALPGADAAMPAVHATAAAWWAFLDEREAARPVQPSHVSE